MSMHPGPKYVCDALNARVPNDAIARIYYARARWGDDVARKIAERNIQKFGNHKPNPDNFGTIAQRNGPYERP
ncbi:MAG: hypothetical protein QXL47_01745 [Candidatus Anstonellales archaeon]